jgi:hypothetical protein
MQIRGPKARCPLCQGELVEPMIIKGTGADSGGMRTAEQSAAAADDPFARIRRAPVSYLLMFQILTFICVSIIILMGAAQVISGFTIGWIYVAVLGILAGWADIVLDVYYRSNILKMLTTQAYMLMALSILIDYMTTRNGWSVSWFIPIMFILIVVITFAVALGQRMQLNEYILYPAFDVLMSLLQIIPIVTGVNRHIAAAVICIALMLILVSSLVIFRGRMLRTAVTKYLHI